jgi:heat shock protein HtpX
VATGSFYGQISANKRNAFLMAALVVVVLGVLGFAIGYAVVGDPAGGIGALILAIGFGSISGLASYFGGDKLVLTVSGEKPVDEASAPQLINVVREMAISANVPMPAVYLIDDSAPNAFATGRDPQHASIAVTTGLLDKLDREELQGVIGHELSHVRNYDIRFALLVGVLVGSVALLADFFLRSVLGRRSSLEQPRGWGWRPGDRVRHRHHPGHPRPDHQPVHPARREPPARVPRRRVVGRADPQPLRPRARPGQDLG